MSIKQYQSRHVDTEVVINNPEEYIIPECLPACKILWDRNIETFMCSNYDTDIDLWIDFDLVSEENVELFHSLRESDPEHYGIDDWYHHYRVVATSSDELEKLVSVFKLQDVKEERYQSGEEFLDLYKRFKMNNDEDIAELRRLYPLVGPDMYYVTTFGGLGLKDEYAINPKKRDATLSDALKAENKTALYVEDEDRVYSSLTFLKWHQKYLKYLQEKQYPKDSNPHKR